MLSPIIWYELASLLGGTRHRVEQVRQVVGFLCRWARLPVPDWKRRLLRLANAVLPNSRAEAAQLRRYFGVDPARMHVVPNGVDPAWVVGPARGWEERAGVLCVGRIEPRKNQLGLIRAVQGTGLRLTLVGKPVPGHEDYFYQCLREGKNVVLYLGALPHRSPELARLYRSARVVALASWYETPGLAALEGAIAGANVVVTAFGSAHEYFGPLAHYVYPASTHSIRSAVLRAHEQPPPADLAIDIRRRFSWRRIALALSRVYQQLRRPDHGSPAVRPAA